uniref:Mastoparan PDD-B n=1 Tax=Polistes dorsalis TaxID=34729 RepID=MASTB_POLDR|nr:RecName: Full=Mastoparan PDD-B [Polistes dorsalis]
INWLKLGKKILGAL